MEITWAFDHQGGFIATEVGTERGLTLAEAQEHCQDPETSSQTATSAAARRRTRERGPWFDGYSQDA